MKHESQIPGTPPQVSIIVVSYNTREMTIDCLKSVYAETTETPFELIVVDNASSDGSAEAIREAFPASRFPNLKLMAETTNYGFAPAHHIARPHCNGHLMLLLNPDTVVLDGALDKLIGFAKRKPDAKIWGGRTLHADGSLNKTSCWRKMSLWTVFCRTTGLSGVFKNSGIFNAEAYASWNRDTEERVDIVTGCLFLLETSFWDQLGGFSETFSMYGEEADLCLRARKAGAAPSITPEATIVHYGGASEPVASDRIVRVLRAKAELIKRHFPIWNKALGLQIFKLHPFSRYYLNALLGGSGLRKSASKQADVWGEVWERRDEWQFGFEIPQPRHLEPVKKT